MKHKFLSTALAALMLLTGAGVEAKKLHTIGDSTMDGYAGQGSDKLGWGAPLQQFMNGLDTESKGITVNNRGKSGASTRTFYTDSRFWATMVTGGSDAMQAGDILLIQFAHNDENNKGVDAVELQAYNAAHGLTAITDLRGTTPTTTYKANLKKYIDEAKAMGVKPILVSAMCRNYWTGATIKANGRHNLKDGYSVLTESGLVENQKLTTDDHSMDYTYQMEQVALEYDDVPYINMTEATAKMFEDLGSAYCNANIFNVGDGTHTGPMGATLIARCFATTLKETAAAETNAKRKAVLDELAQYVSLNSDIALSPETMDFGSTYVSTSVVKTFNIAGFDLTPAAGNYTISATEGYEVSLDGETYAASITPAYEGGSIFANVKVRGTCAVDGKMDGTLTVSCGSIEKTASLTMTGILNTSGTESQVVWSMEDGSATPNQTGELTAGEEVISGLVVGSPIYQEIDGVKYRRYKTSEAWPDQMDEVSDRYIQFSAEVPDGKNFRLDKISLDVVAVATANMRCRIYYATKADFTDAVQIKEFTSMASNTANHVSVMPMKNLTKGDKVYVRVYPWMQGASASGKYIALKDVTIHGYTEDIPTTEEVTAVWNSTLVTNKTSNDTTLTSSVGLVLTVVNNGTSANDYVNNVANDFLHWNGASKTTARYAKFTAPSDGHIVVTYQSNNSTAKDRIVAVAKSIVLGSDSATLAQDENVFGCGYTDGYTEKTISVDVTAGDVYVYNAYSGCRVNSISFTYTRNIVTPDPDPEPSTDPVTATWDFTALTDVNVEGKIGTIDSDVEGIVLTVDATNGKLKYNGSNSAQFNAGTIIQVPVISTKDVVTVKAFSGYQAKISISGVAMDQQQVEYTATEAEVKAGYVEVTATANAYLLLISVVQNPGAQSDPKPEGELKEALLYFTNFQDWEDAASSTAASSKTVTTLKSNESLTFTWAETQISATGTNTKFTNSEVVTPGYAMCAKTATPYFETSVLASVTKVHFVHAATGSSRGWGLKVKGDGDADWVTVSSNPCDQAGTAVDVEVNRTNCQLRFYNLNASQNAYMLELGIYGNVVVEPRTFKDFKIDFRTNPYTVITPAEGLPEGVVLTGTDNINGAQHGLNQGATITVPVDGPVHFTIGGCSYNNGDVIVTDHTGAQIAAINTKMSCENAVSNVATAPYASYATWNYNVEAPETLTFNFAKAYLPYFFAEACEYIANVKVTYFDQNGTRLGETEIAPGLAFDPAYTVDDLPAIPEGKAFRGWYTNVSEKAPAVINADIKLYALVTDIETPTVGSHYLYDLTKSTFYMEDHELISSTGAYKNTHGWGFSNGQNIKLVVSPKSYVIVGLCAYTNTSDQTITNKAGEVVGTMHVIRNGEEGATTDGATYSFYNESADVDTLTFNFTTTSYIHTVEVFNVAAQVEKSETGYYVIPSGDAASLMMVLKALNKGDKVFLPNGTYDLGKVALTTVGVDSVSIIGESMGGVLVKNYPDEEGIGITATILLTGKNCYFQDLTLQCYAKASASAGRGVALQDKGTNNIFKNVFLQGTQDTYYSNGPQGMKAYFENGRIEGTVDFICGSGTVYFKDMQVGVVSRSSANVICAPNTKAGEQFGYVFDGCTIDAAADQVGKYNLCRPWNDSPAATWINTTLLQVGSAAGYTNMTDGLKLRFHEFNTVDANGAAVTGHNLTACKGNTESETLYLTAAEAEAYSYANVLGTWNPAVDATQVTLEYVNNTWTGATDAASFLVNGEIVTELPNAPVSTDVIRAANARGGFGPAATINNTNTSVENTDATTKVVKTIVNGQVVIIKNGVSYNVLGARL